MGGYRGKTAGKTAKSPLNGAEIPLGAHIGNTGGKKGRSGRPPKAFKDFLARLRQSPTVQKSIEDALSDPENKGFSSALKVLTNYDDEKPGHRISIDTARLKAMSDEDLQQFIASRRKR